MQESTRPWVSTGGRRAAEMVVGTDTRCQDAIPPKGSANPKPPQVKLEPLSAATRHTCMKQKGSVPCAPALRGPICWWLATPVSNFSTGRALQNWAPLLLSGLSLSSNGQEGALDCHD